MPGPSNPHQSPLPLSIGVEQTDAAGFSKPHGNQSVMELSFTIYAEHHQSTATRSSQPAANHAPNMHDAKTPSPEQ